VRQGARDAAVDAGAEVNVRRLVCTLGALVAMGGAVPRASASPLFELVGSGPGGLNPRATGASAASAYFNPSLLPRAKPGIEVGWLLLSDSISIGLEARSPTNDVPLSSVDRVGTDHPPVPTAWLEQGCTPRAGNCVRDVPSMPRQGDGSSSNLRGYQMIGLVNHLLGESLSLGLYALVPLSSFTQAHSFFVDEREQFFSNSLHPELYADRLTPVSLAFGAGSRVWKQLYLGLSLTLGLNNAASAGAYVGNSRLLDQTLELSTKVDVETTVSPHVAVTYLPSAGSSLSFTLHSPQKIAIDTQFGIYLPNGDIQYARRTATHSWLPWIAALAGSYDLSRTSARSWELAGTLTFERWSRYVNRQTERPSSAYAFRDLVTGALGVHFRQSAWASALDASYRRSPVPPQTGRTNYVDNDRLGLSLGLSYDVPIPRYAATFKVAAQTQVHVLPERSQHKLDPRNTSNVPASQLVQDEWPDSAIDISTGQVIAEASGLQTNNPGWPGYRSRGLITASSITLALLF
jgi:long-chain fatty acid transport protein